jgi:glycosyltransferase involved in cell wall biosynthesis
MRILYLSATAQLGGAERSLLELIAGIRQAEPSWVLHLLTADQGPVIERAAALGVATTVLPFGRSLAQLGESGATPLQLAAALVRASVPIVGYVLRLRRAIRAYDPDLVHTNGLKMHVLGAWGCSPRTALVWHLHDYVGNRRLATRLLRRYATRCAAIVANSVSVARDARAALGDHVTVVPIYNAVDLERCSEQGDQLDLDALAGLPPASPGVVRVGLVATLARWKGHTTFLDALARMPAEIQVRGYVVGDALYRTAGSQYSLDDLRRYAIGLGLRDRVGFTGFVAQPEAAMRALDIVVHASTAPEPFGLVIAEAMACGRAVIAADAGGAREIFTPGVDALGHTPGSADSLAAAIAALARDPDARRRMGIAGRQTAERRFDRTRLASELIPVYRRAVAS